MGDSVTLANVTGTESCIRLIDVDQDGKLDIIFSVARLLNTSIDDLFHDNASRRSFEELCRQRGKLSIPQCFYLYLYGVFYQLH